MIKSGEAKQGTWMTQRMVVVLMDNKVPKWCQCRRIDGEYKSGYAKLAGSPGGAFRGARQVIRNSGLERRRVILASKINQGVIWTDMGVRKKIRCFMAHHMEVISLHFIQIRVYHINIKNVLAQNLNK